MAFFPFIAFPDVLQPLPHPLILSVVLAVLFSSIMVRYRFIGLALTAILLVIGLPVGCLTAKRMASKQDHFWVTDFKDMHTSVAILYDNGSTVYAQELDTEGRLKPGSTILVIPNPKRDLSPVRKLHTIAR